VRRYETVFILRPDLGEAQTRELISRFGGIVASGGGDLIETDEWGMRELAYRIKGERRGYYVRLDYVADGAVTNEVERNLKLSDSVLRYLSVMVEDDADAARARAEVEAHRARRAAAMQARATPSEQAAEGAGDETAEIPDAPEEIIAEAAETVAEAPASIEITPPKEPTPGSGGESD
jgi:small subunit ribosomal protein S6